MSLLLLDLDLFVFVVIVLLASKSCLYRIPVTAPCYTSLGQTYKSKSYATSHLSLVFQNLEEKPGEGGLTLHGSV
jgi:hypothetical protein